MSTPDANVPPDTEVVQANISDQVFGLAFGFIVILIAIILILASKMFRTYLSLKRLKKKKIYYHLMKFSLQVVLLKL